MSIYKDYPRYEQKPVNFGGHDATPNHDSYALENPRHSIDAESKFTQYTTGVPAFDTTTPSRNEFGQTEAEVLASQYRLSPSSSRLVDPHTSERKPSYIQNRKSVGSHLDAVTYIDEDFNYYPSRSRDQAHDPALIHNAADMGRTDTRGIQDLEYQDPYKPNDTISGPPEKQTLMGRFLDKGRYPLEQRIEDKKRGVGRQRYPFVALALTTAMVSVLIYELVVNAQQQGAPISFKPVVNPMLGPSQSALIQLGARFPPCMKIVKDVPLTLLLPCLNDTANPPDRLCPISELCGFGGVNDGNPSQWFRFITPIFLHGGIVHLILNMLAQMLLSAQIEREMGSIGFLLLYFAAGIFGNVLGGNFALVGVPSVGASGAIFGTVAVTWVDLIAHWKYQYKPITKLVFMTVELMVGVAIGFIPYVDNFAHMGGFFMGLLVGTTLYPVISETKRHKAIMIGFRITAIPIAVILFVVLIRNFYTSDPYAACKGCRYLSCIPTNANNHCMGTGITTTTTNLRREL